MFRIFLVGAIVLIIFGIIASAALYDEIARGQGG